MNLTFGLTANEHQTETILDGIPKEESVVGNCMTVSCI